jgi:hypothetical protein
MADRGPRAARPTDATHWHVGERENGEGVKKQEPPIEIRGSAGRIGLDYLLGGLPPRGAHLLFVMDDRPECLTTASAAGEPKVRLFNVIGKRSCPNRSDRAGPQFEVKLTRCECSWHCRI